MDVFVDFTDTSGIDVRFIFFFFILSLSWRALHTQTHIHASKRPVTCNFQRCIFYVKKRTSTSTRREIFHHRPNPRFLERRKCFSFVFRLEEQSNNELTLANLIEYQSKAAHPSDLIQCIRRKTNHRHSFVRSTNRTRQRIIGVSVYY